MSEQKFLPLCNPYGFPTYIIPESHQGRSLGASADEDNDREHFALHIATVHHWENSQYKHKLTKEQAAAYAKLFAAAPELLAACKQVIRGWGHQDGISKAVEMARAAIAKAEGE